MVTSGVDTGGSLLGAGLGLCLSSVFKNLFVAAISHLEAQNSGC